MTQKIRFPSDEFPGVPAISLVLPEKWAAAAVPATMLAAVREVEEGQFVSNVIVRTQRVGSSDDLAVAAAAVDAGIDQLAEVQDVSRAMLESDGRQVYCREFAYRDPQVGTVTQAWRVLAVPHEGVTDVFELVGTISPQRISDLTEIRSLMDTVEISDVVPAGQH